MHAARKLGSLSLSGLKRRKRVRLKTIDKEAVVTHLSQYGGRFCHSCGLDNVNIILVCVQTRLWSGLISVFIHHSHRVALFDGDVL